MPATDLYVARTGFRLLEDAQRALDAGALILLGSWQGQSGRGRSILFGAAALMTDVMVVRMATCGRGLVSIAVNSDTAFRLGLRRMAGRSGSIPRSGEYLVSIEAASCSGTGISARDRAATLRAAGAPNATQDDVVMPGHVMPLLIPGQLDRNSALPMIAHAILRQSTEYPVIAWCDVLNSDGDVANLDQAFALAGELELPVVIVDDCSVLTNEPELP